MDFEKIIEYLPVAVTVWRLDSDLRSDDINSHPEFRLVYANASASFEAEIDLFDYVGRKLDSIPPGPFTKYPTAADLWIRVILRNKPEKISKEIEAKTFEILAYPLDSRCVVSTFKDITADIVISQRTTQSVKSIKSVEEEFTEYKKRKSGLYAKVG